MICVPSQSCCELFRCGALSLHSKIFHVQVSPCIMPQETAGLRLYCGVIERAKLQQCPIALASLQCWLLGLPGALCYGDCALDTLVCPTTHGHLAKVTLVCPTTHGHLAKATVCLQLIGHRPLGVIAMLQMHAICAILTFRCRWVKLKTALSPKIAGCRNEPASLHSMLLEALARRVNDTPNPTCFFFLSDLFI